MNYNENDLTIGRQVVRTIVDFKSNPPLVKREFQSLGKLHAELLFFGFRLENKKSWGPEAGYLLAYVKSNVMVKVKTRGDRGRYRGGSPHLSVILLSGTLDDNGKIETEFENEEGKFHVGGGLVSKNIKKKSKYFSEEASADGKGRQEDWADQTHFAFPDQDLDDSIIEQL